MMRKESTSNAHVICSCPFALLQLGNNGLFLYCAARICLRLCKQEINLQCIVNAIESQMYRKAMHDIAVSEFNSPNHAGNTNLWQ